MVNGEMVKSSTRGTELQPVRYTIYHLPFTIPRRAAR
jgi:hypothetical protein